MPLVPTLAGSTSSTTRGCDGNGSLHPAGAKPQAGPSSLSPITQMSPDGRSVALMRGVSSAQRCGIRDSHRSAGSLTWLSVSITDMRSAISGIRAPPPFARLAMSPSHTKAARYGDELSGDEMGGIADQEDENRGQIPCRVAQLATYGKTCCDALVESHKLFR